MRMDLRKNIFLLLCCIAFFLAGCRESVDRAYDSLKDRPYPFDVRIEECILRNFPRWSQAEKIEFVARICPLTDGGASYILWVYAHHYGILPQLEKYAEEHRDQKLKYLAVSAKDIPDSEYRVLKNSDMIPFELRIFNFIFEGGCWFTLILVAAWLVYALQMMIRLNRRFWWWLLILSCVILPMNLGFTWCGFHYRMELRDRYARDSTGLVNIDKMHPVIRAEYAKHDYHPRFRDMKAQMIGCIAMLPVVYLFGGIGWLLTRLCRKLFAKRGEDELEENG